MKIMDISRENYEAWLLDLIEGRLSTDQTQQLHEFLRLNPDCALGRDEFHPWKLEAKTVAWDGKSDLRKEIPHEGSVVSVRNFDLFSIARMEGDLNDRQERDFIRLIGEDEEKMEEWLRWKEMKLIGENISFDGKKTLKQRYASRSRVIWISIASAAAAITLFFTLFTPERGDTGSDRFLPLEASVDIESNIEEEVPESAEVVTASVEKSSTLPLVLASEPAFLSIQKHHNPPELSGEKSDTTVWKVQEKNLIVAPLKIAMLEKGLLMTPGQGSYDRIEPLNLPSFPAYSAKGLKQAYQDFVEKNDISLLTIANAGIEGINFLAGSDLSMNLSRDEEGGVSGFRFRSERLSVDAPVKKAE